MSTSPNYETTGPAVLPEIDFSGLELSYGHDGADAPEVYHLCGGLEVVTDDLVGVGREIKAEAGTAIEESKLQRKLRRRIIWFAVAAIVFLLVVAAVLGGVLGSRHHRSTPAASSSSTPSSTPSSTTSNSVYSSSSIGLTGWWTSTSSFSIRLVYQGEGGYLRLIGYNSEDSKWSTVTTLTDPAPKLGSPIATCCYNDTIYFNTAVTSNSNYTQIDIFYVDKTGQIRGWEVQEQQTPGVLTSNTNGTISLLGLKPGAGSRLAAYWPSLIFEDFNEIQEVYYTNRSALAEIPYSTNSTRQGGGNFIYQRDDQRLLAEERSNPTATLRPDAPAISVPPQTPIGAFSIPRTPLGKQSIEYLYFVAE